MSGDDQGVSIDPVEELLASARHEARSDSFRVTGVMMQYYAVCERELWFLSRDIEIDRGNPAVVRGTEVDENAYGERRESYGIDGMIALDLLEDGRVVEVKPSSEIVEGARLQLLYYLWYLKHVVGIEKEGVLAHPRERRRETVQLTEKHEDRVESAIRGIHTIVSRDTPPEAEEKPFCDSCAYHDFCWS